MRQRKKYYPYVCLLVTLFFLLNLPTQMIRGFRSFTICSISPSWHTMQLLKEKTMFFLTIPMVQGKNSQELIWEYESLKRENQLLCTQLENMRKWLLSEDRIEEQLSRLRSFHLDKEDKELISRRYEQVSRILSMQLKALPATVVYREPSCWSSYLWLNVGQRHNRSLGQSIVAKNSPVVLGNALVGIVEEIRESQCKVRLITDANLAPAVRAARGGIQDQFLYEQIQSLFYLFQLRKDLFHSPEEEKELFSFVQKIQSKLRQKEMDIYLAKGEIHGSGMPLWRSRGGLLKGFGFNYDFPDEEGPARDLRTGEPYGGKRQAPLSLLKEGDMLITSGLDGIFPQGLEVAIVTKVACLREGASAYEIEAKAVAGDFNELSTVFVLPPIDFQSP